MLYDRSTSGRLSRGLCGAGEDGAGDDGCRAFVVSGSGDHTIKIWNPLTGACVKTLKGDSPVTVLYDRSTSGRLSRALCGIDEDGAGDDGCRAFVVSGSRDHTIKIWNPLTGACVQTLKGHSKKKSDFVRSVTVLYDRSTNGRLSRALCGTGEEGAVTADVVRLLWRERDKTIKIWNPLTGACVQTLKGH